MIAGASFVNGFRLTEDVAEIVMALMGLILKDCTIASILAMVQFFRVNPTDTAAISATSSVSLKPLANEAPAIITREEFEAAKQYKAEHPDLLHELPDLYERLSSIEQTYYTQNKK